MLDANLKNNRGMIVRATSLPYYDDNKKVCLDTLEFGEMIVDEDKFADLTTEGGRFHQFYTYKINAK